MSLHPPAPPAPGQGAVSEDELHAWVDGQLPDDRHAAVQAHLRQHADDAARVQAWQAQNRALQALCSPVLDEALPPRLLSAATHPPARAAANGRTLREPAEPSDFCEPTDPADPADLRNPPDPRRPRSLHDRRAAAHGAPLAPRPWLAWAAGLLLPLLGGVVGWQLHALQAPAASAPAWAQRDGVPPWPAVADGAQPGPQAGAAVVGGISDGPLGPIPAYARQAAVAHAVYAPDPRRAVEIGAEHEDQLITWLSRRLGTPVRAARLQALGYALEGGRLLPGEQRPVAQFMYRHADGRRLTLYVTHEAASAQAAPLTGFQFARSADVQLFFWSDSRFGYALAAQLPGTRGAARGADALPDALPEAAPQRVSADEQRAELGRLAAEVYRQLAP